jgi:hypothetical protein
MSSFLQFSKQALTRIMQFLPLLGVGSPASQASVLSPENTIIPSPRVILRIRYATPVDFAIDQGLANVRLEGLPCPAQVEDILRSSRHVDGRFDSAQARSRIAKALNLQLAPKPNA